MGIFIILTILFITLIIVFLYYDHKTKVYFESKGVRYLGNGVFDLLVSLTKGVNITEMLSIKYRHLKSNDIKVAGANNFGEISLLVRDPDLLRSILVKDFNHFANRSEIKVGSDLLFSKTLIALRGEKWKALRSKLSPTFTTGKIKRLFSLFDQSGKKLVKYLEQEIGKDAEMDLAEGYSKFTMDVIASAVCGIDSHAFDQKEPSFFERMGMKLQLKFGAVTILKMVIIIGLPKLAEWLGLGFFEKEVQEFFMVAIKSSIHDRQEKNEKRNDFIQLMLEARENKLNTDESELDNFEKDALIKKDNDDEDSSSTEMLDDDGIVANSVLFMLAGYDTTQSLLIFCAYSLAIHQDIQVKLRAEVDSVLEENGGEFSYDAMNNMTFLDMVINETLRFYPPAPFTDRGCSLEFKVPGTEFVLKKNGGIMIPIMAIHHDEEFWPEPESFNPERFSLENKHKINPYTFLPFGAGGHNCIGRRFALTEVKVAISHLVHNFRIEPSKKTLIPMKYSQSNSLKPEGGMFLALAKIKH